MEKIKRNIKTVRYPNDWRTWEGTDGNTYASNKAYNPNRVYLVQENGDMILNTVLSHYWDN